MPFSSYFSVFVSAPAGISGAQFKSRSLRRVTPIRAAVSNPPSPELHRRSTTCIIRPGSTEHQAARLVAAPAVAHHARVQTPLQAPIVEPSHTSISVPLGSVDLYGNYTVFGPAIIRKVNNILVALVQPGGAVSVLCNPEGPMVMSSASLSHDDAEAALCNLGGTHLELDGSYVLQDETEGIKHDGKTIVSVSHLSDDNRITLLPGGSVSHPVNVHPRMAK